jgi:LPXTG-motif cell wall-anchored protein
LEAAAFGVFFALGADGDDLLLLLLLLFSRRRRRRYAMLVGLGILCQLIHRAHGLFFL